MRLKKWLLISLFSTSIGEWLYFIALNLRVLDLTNSALAVSGLYMLIPLAMLLTNGWAGSVVDRVNVRKLMILINSGKVVVILCLVFSTDLRLIYCLSFIIHMMSAIYRTAEFVYITKLVPEAEQQRFNAWKSMAQSSGFILGPSIAGALFIVGSVEAAIVVNAILLICSILIHLVLPNTTTLKNDKSFSVSALLEDWCMIVRYATNNQFVALVFIVNAFYGVCISSIDSLEAAFSIHTLQLDESAYGLLVSVAGIGFVVGSIVNIKWMIAPVKAIKCGMLLTASGYFIYGVSSSWGMAAVGFFIVSGSLPFVNVGYMTFVQKQLNDVVLGRFLSIFSLIEAIGIISMTGILGVMTEMVSLRSLVIGGVILLVSVVILFTVVDREL